MFDQFVGNSCSVKQKMELLHVVVESLRGISSSNIGTLIPKLKPQNESKFKILEDQVSSPFDLKTVTSSHSDTVTLLVKILYFPWIKYLKADSRIFCRKVLLEKFLLTCAMFLYSSSTLH